ncbi:MAG: hypothetical protein ACK4NQ_06490 [Fimbriimonadaceae bacterium]
MMPPLHPVEQALTDLCQQHPELRWEQREGGWHIGRQEFALEFRIEQEPERFTLHAPEGHGHYSKLDVLLDDLKDLLDGSATIVNLLRDGEPAQTGWSGPRNPAGQTGMR